MTAPPELAHHDITVKSIKRRLFGLPREVTLVRCTCGERLHEFPNPHQAAVWTRAHCGSRP